jgi:hypothetical protein
LWAHGRDFSDWLAKSQGAQVPSSYIRDEAWVSPVPKAPEVNARASDLWNNKI